MPATINPLRKARVKQELLNPNNTIAEALIKAGYAEKSARGKSGAMKVVKVCRAEILAEIDKKGLANKAYKVLGDKLQAPKDSDAISAAANILKFAEGETVNTRSMEQTKALDEYYANLLERRVARQ